MAVAIRILGSFHRPFLGCCFDSLRPFRQAALFAWRGDRLGQISTLCRRLHVLAGNQQSPVEYDVCHNGAGHSHHGGCSRCRIWQCDYAFLGSFGAIIWALWRSYPRQFSW